MSDEISRERRPSFLRTWFLFDSVLGALILRELQGRYGRQNVGFLWVVFEPLLLASVVTTIHATQKHSFGASSSIQPFAFAVTGYCLLIIFRSNFGRAVSALPEAMPLLYHSQITPTDVMLARVICDTLGALMSFVILMTFGILIGLAEFPHRPLYLFLSIAELTTWSFGLALVVASYSHRYHVIHNLVPPITYFSFPLSGAFFTMSFLPPWAREYMAWNPMAGMFETARYGMFELASPDYMFPGYVIAHCMLSVYWGLFEIRRARKEIHVV